ncbi:MAG: uroporphyrinogen decarboxylase family protein [Deltaproteobacteria bacterium]|nr:uroporphyrinogen decarboxylase family protein [Deltaproteobacteria bacterium]
MPYTELKRFHDALKGRTEDRVPVFVGVSLWAAANFPEAPFKTIASDPDLIVKSQLWARGLIGGDSLYPSADPLFIAEAFGCEVRFLETGAMVDPLPITIGGVEDIEKMPFPNPRKTGRFPVVLEAARKLSEQSHGEVPLIGTFEGAFTQTCRVIEVEQILRMIYKNPQTLEFLLDRMNEFLIDFGQALIENGVNILFIPEPTASSTMIAPRMFRQLVLPRLQKLIRELDVPVVLHICGDTKPILDAMGEAGAEIISLDQCMDLSESRALVPDKVLGGNVDPIQSLLMGDVEKVKEDALQCIQGAGTERFILMPGCSVPPNSPVENLKAMVTAAIEYGLGEQ